MRLSKYIDLSKVPSPTIYKNSMGVTFELHLEEYLMKQIYLYDLYERNTVRYLRRMVKPGMTCMDCGANSGFYTLTLAACAGESGQVHAFEPVSVNYERLAKNVSLNNFQNIHLNKFGVSNKEEELTIHFGGDNLGTASIYKDKSAKQETITLKTLDAYCASNEIETIDFIKIDIEGGEKNCLEGAKEVFGRSKKMAMIMEIMEDNCQSAGYTSDELFHLVLDMGFKPYLPKGWPFDLKPLDSMPVNFYDNIIFLKGY